MLFNLAAALDFACADDLRREIAPAFERAEAITLDASSVKVVDLAALQLLFAVHATAAQRGLRFEVKGGGSRAIEDAAQAFGFPERLGCTAVCRCGDASRG